MSQFLVKCFLYARLYCTSCRTLVVELQHESLLLLLWPLWQRNKGLVQFAMLNWSQSSRTWKKFKGLIRLQGCEILSFHWIRKTVQIEDLTVRPNFYVNIPEQFTIRECMRLSFKLSPIRMSKKMITWEKKSHVVSYSGNYAYLCRLLIKTYRSICVTFNFSYTVSFFPRSAWTATLPMSIFSMF